ncbi:MAG: hypothetical protein ASARMPRED_002759 [Alectoria sarmentosa]|nr:MAG: hypothetical protein ASARMPRED_002759 [Alectoria sarmentosa]
MPGVHLPPAGPSAAHLEYKKVALPPELKSSAKASVASLTSLLIYIQILSATANKDPPDAPKQRTMAPHPTLNASSTVPPNLGPSYLPQPTAFQLGGFNQNQWGPDAIDEERGRRTRVGGRPVDDVADEVAMVDLAGGLGSERVAVGMDEGSREDEGFVKIERGMRTDTEGTLVGRDEDDEGEVKGFEE